MPLVVVQDPCVRDAGGPGREHVAAIASRNREVALGQGERNRPALDRLAHGANFRVGQLPRLHQLCPRGIRILAVQLSAQDRLLRVVRIEHVMESEIVDVLARDLRHPAGPPAVAPRDEANRSRPPAAWPWRTRQSCARRSRGRTRSCRTRSRSRSASIGCRTAPPPRVPCVPRGPGRCSKLTHSAASCASAGADARSESHVLPSAVGFEVHAHEGLGPDLAAEPGELAGPTWFDSIPPQSRLTSGGRAAARADAFPPAVIVGKNAAPAHHRWRRGPSSPRRRLRARRRARDPTPPRPSHRWRRAVP